jgi:hypothetical protein
MRWLVGLVLSFLILTLPANGAPNQEPDYSKPELVKQYLFMPCDLLERSYDFQYRELVHLTNHLQECNKAAEMNTDDKYAKVMCLYIGIQWQLMFEHAKSVEKAWELVCNDDGTKKNPEYEIQF